MNGQCYEAPLPFTLRQAQGERKRILAIVFPGCAPFAGSGRTEAHIGDRLPWLCTLRQAQGERKRILAIVFPGCAPCDRLRANGSALWGSSSPAVHPATGSGRTEAHFGDRLSRLFALRQAQGERKRILGIVFPGCSAFDRLRANGLRCQRHHANALWGHVQTVSEGALGRMCCSC